MSNLWYKRVMKLYFKVIPSPVGKLKLVCNEQALVAVLWENEKNGRVKLPKMEANPNNPLLLDAEGQLEEYFNGEREQFDLPLDPIGTDFQKKVWNELKKISYGATLSYGEIAAKIGSPKSARAIGAANGRNPISIIVPCHRVIGISGDLTGFAGGLNYKEKLLSLEKKSR